MSQTFSIYEAKARLSELIRLVKSRRNVIITERGVPVARMVPYRGSKVEPLEGRIERLKDLGAVLTPTHDFDAKPVVRLRGATSRFLEKDRD
jgi:prevent-host-death family protein